MNQISALYVLRRPLVALALLAVTGLSHGQTSKKADSENGKNMKIVTVLRDDDCGSEAIPRLKEVASRLGVEITIDQIIIENEEQAKALNWPGSPTVRIKGLDIDPKVREESSGMA